MSQFEGRQENFLTWERVNLFVLFRLSADWIKLAHVKRATCFTRSIDLNVDNPESPLRKLPKQCLTKYLGTPWPSQLNTRLTITALSGWGWRARASNTSLAREGILPMPPSRNHLLYNNITYIISFSVTWLLDLAITL